MLYNRFLIEIIPKEDLSHFFDTKYTPNFDLENTKDIFSRTLELAYDQEDVLATNVIHACFDMEEERYCAFMNIGTTTAVDDLVRRVYKESNIY